MKALLKSLWRQPLGLIALFFVLAGGGAYAASAAWTGDNIVDSSLTGTDVANGSLTGADIQDGSLTAADVTGVGTPAPVLDWTVSGPLSFGSTAHQVTLTSIEFSVPNDGFYDVLGKGKLSAVGPVCSAFFFAGASALLDVKTTSAGLGNLVEGGPAIVEHSGGIVHWLDAGTHSVKIIGDAFCEGTVGSGSFDLTDIRLVIKPA